MEESNKQHSAAAFLEKLYEILEDPTLEPYISWQPDGKSFLIKKVNELSEYVLPRWFKHNNLQSFIRQLNMYSFSKTKHDSNHREFHNPLFQKGRRDLLPLIRRKAQAYSQNEAPSALGVGAMAGVSRSSGDLSTSSAIIEDCIRDPHGDTQVSGIASLLQVSDIELLDPYSGRVSTGQLDAFSSNAPLEASGIDKDIHLKCEDSGSNRFEVNDSMSATPQTHCVMLTSRVAELERQIEVINLRFSSLSSKHNTLCIALERFLRPLMPVTCNSAFDKEGITSDLLSHREHGDRYTEVNSASTPSHTNVFGADAASAELSPSVYPEWSRFRSNSLGSMTAASVSSAIDSKGDHNISDEYDDEDDNESVSSYSSAFSAESTSSGMSRTSKKRDRMGTLSGQAQSSIGATGSEVNDDVAKGGRKDRARKTKYRRYNKPAIPQSLPTIYDVLEILGDCKVQDVFASSSPISSVLTSRLGSHSPISFQRSSIPGTEGAMVLYGTRQGSMLSPGENGMDTGKKLSGLDAMALAAGLHSHDPIT